VPKVAARIAHRAQSHGGSLADALGYVLETNGRGNDSGYGILLDF
jgi:hypothetical protein